MSNFVETNCTIEHEGQAFESGGALVTDDVCIAYPSDKYARWIQGQTGWGHIGSVYARELHDWHGNVIGVWWEVSSRKAVFFGHRSWQGSTWYYMRARLNDGREYALRGFGVGMIARGKRIKSK